MEVQPITLPISGFIRASGLSRQRVYNLLRIGEIGSVVIGSRRYVLIETYRAYLDRLRTAAQKDAALAPTPWRKVKL